MHRISGRSQLLLVEKSAGMFSTVLCNGDGVEKQLPAATSAIERLQLLLTRKKLGKRKQVW